MEISEQLVSEIEIHLLSGERRAQLARRRLRKRLSGDPAYELQTLEKIEQAIAGHRERQSSEATERAARLREEKEAREAQRTLDIRAAWAAKRAREANASATTLLPSIPLNRARITWNKGGAVFVEDIQKPSNSKLPHSHGACWAPWQTSTDAERIGYLLNIKGSLIEVYGIMPDLVHRAFCVIPEYRQLSKALAV